MSFLLCRGSCKPHVGARSRPTVFPSRTKGVLYCSEGTCEAAVPTIQSLTISAWALRVRFSCYLCLLENLSSKISRMHQDCVRKVKGVLFGIDGLQVSLIVTTNKFWAFVARWQRNVNDLSIRVEVWLASNWCLSEGANTWSIGPISIIGSCTHLIWYVILMESLRETLCDCYRTLWAMGQQ